MYPNAQMLPAMLISKQPSINKFNKALASQKYLGQIKKDGYWYQLEKTDNGEVYLFSRTKSKKTGYLAEKIDNVPHIKEWAKETLPNGTTLIGEIYYPGKKSSDTTKIMGCLPQTAVYRQTKAEDFGGLIHYYIHDIIRYNGSSLLEEPFIKRAATYYTKINATDTVEKAEIFEKELGSVLGQAFLDGEEGMVFKSKEGLYLPGKRPTYNFKAKTECSLDVVISGFIPPEMIYTGKDKQKWKYWVKRSNPKEKIPIGAPHLSDDLPVTKAFYFDWVMGIEVGAWESLHKFVKIGRVSSGMTDFLREDMAKNPNDYLNKVVEVQAMSVDPKERTLRHARLMRLRDDKLSEECKISDIF